MMIKLRSVLNIAQVLGGKEYTVHVDDGATVQGVIGLLLVRYGEPLGALLLQNREPLELLPFVKIYVNGRGADFLDGLDTKLQEGDDVLLMPQISGG